MIARVGNRYSILCGNDNILLPMLSCGAQGAVSVLSNVYPQIPCFLYKNYIKNLQKCTFLHNKCINFINSLFLETNPMCIKYVLFKQGFCKNNCEKREGWLSNVIKGRKLQLYTLLLLLLLLTPSFISLIHHAITYSLVWKRNNCVYYIHEGFFHLLVL